jgi:glycosyltransferase involved in cell wall biosynthesis
LNSPATPPAGPVIFAQNLFLPEDLGGSRYPIEVVPRIAARGRPVTVVTSRLHGKFPPIPGVDYRLYPITRFHSLATHASNVISAAWSFRGPRTDPRTVLVAGSYDVALAASLAGLTNRVPLVFLYHSEFYSEWVQALGHGVRDLGRRAIRSYMRWVERRVFGAAARIVAVSQFSATQIRARSPELAHKIVVVPTGVDTAFFQPPASKQAARAAVGVYDDGLLLLGVGRLAGVKQFDRLVDAVALLGQLGVPARLLIAGEGPMRPDLERQARELGIADRVELRGFRDGPALRALMQAADLQVCSSAFENFSLAILEGMACGTPVVGTPGGGTPELVGEVDADLVLPNDSSAAMAELIARLSRQPGRLAELGARARAMVAERYDWERIVDRLDSLLAEVTAG